MTLDKGIMPYFNKFIHVYGCNLSIFCSTLKNNKPQNFTIGKSCHPVSKSLGRHCYLCIIAMYLCLHVSDWYCGTHRGR